MQLKTHSEGENWGRLKSCLKSGLIFKIFRSLYCIGHRPIGAKMGKVLAWGWGVVKRVSSRRLRI
jgi:hypothetical protein